MVQNGNKRKGHYITGLGDGNVKPSLRSRGHEVALRDDDNYENFLRTELKHKNQKRLRHGVNEDSWGERLFGGGSGSVGEMERANGFASEVLTRSCPGDSSHSGKRFSMESLDA